MFTGLVGGTTRVLTNDAGSHLGVLTLEPTSYLSADLRHGASVAVNGACLTAVSIESDQVVFDVVAPTLRRSTVPTLHPGALVNLERSLAHGAEVGGHDVSGHVDSTASIARIDEMGDGVAHVFVDLAANDRAYVFAKGFIAIDGVSLTISEVTPTGFGVWIIPETRRATRFQALQEGDSVNVEFAKGVQVVVDTIRRGIRELARDGTTHLELTEQQALADMLGIAHLNPSALRPANMPELGNQGGKDRE